MSSLYSARWIDTHASTPRIACDAFHDSRNHCRKEEKKAVEEDVSIWDEREW